MIYDHIMKCKQKNNGFESISRLGVTFPASDPACLDGNDLIPVVIFK